MDNELPPPPTVRSPENSLLVKATQKRFNILDAVTVLAGSSANHEDILINTVPEITHNVTGAKDVDVVDSEGYTDVNSAELFEDIPVSQMIDTKRDEEQLPTTRPRPIADAAADSFINTQRM